MSDLATILNDDALPEPPKRLTRVSFHGVKRAACTMEVNMVKGAKTDMTFTIPDGIVHRYGASKGVVVFWGDVAYHLRSALPASPELRAALRDILDEADRAAAGGAS